MATDYLKAVNILKDSVIPADTETSGLDGAYGRILAEDIYASVNIPSFDRSPYDGYAFLAEDTKGASIQEPKTLKVIDDIKAGQMPSKEIKSGYAIRLMTGAPVPAGADAVCKYEDTVFDDTSVTISKEYSPGDNIIRAGEDIKAGRLIAEKGSVIDAGLIASMASLGIVIPRVYRRPVAGIISTGDEVIDASCTPPPGKIRNSNRYTIAAALLSIGFDTVYLGHAGDDIDDIRNLIDGGFNTCDVTVSTGGVSAGDYDLVPDAMKEAGYEILLRGVAMKPGMACAYGLKDGKIMLALSGNPASSLTNLQCVCYPALKKLAGYREYDHKLFRAKLKDGFSKSGKGTRFLRGRLGITGNEIYISVPSGQGNVVISSAIGCNAYGILNDTAAPAKEGTLIDCFCV
ncbi:MAG: molybdopterin molybdotransferase MoeA [Lachnospiraceae bacterium]|nr:molybdopterin molybdotransferase MoeA [Lachnospiraceae bacterium]